MNGSNPSDVDLPPSREPHDSSTERIKRNLTLEIGLRDLIGETPAFRAVLDEIEILAATDATVLISGETGTGKDLCARAIHYTGSRASKPFFPINCGSIPDELFENQFFGHERGAYTDARFGSKGILLEADGGTLFLDDLEALTPKNQVKLLRFIQTGSYVPLGGVKEIRANVRIVAATNDDLGNRRKEGTFRDDLYFRLAVLTLSLPPLRDRINDIDLLARSFMRRYAVAYTKSVDCISGVALSKLRLHSWPGNVRELENVIHRAVVHAKGTMLTELDICCSPEEGDSFGGQIEHFSSFRQMKQAFVADFEKKYVVSILQSCGGNISEAARRCNKNRRAFWELMRKYDIAQSPTQSASENS